MCLNCRISPSMSFTMRLLMATLLLSLAVTAMLVRYTVWMHVCQVTSCDHKPALHDRLTEFNIETYQVLKAPWQSVVFESARQIPKHSRYSPKRNKTTLSGISHKKNVKLSNSTSQHKLRKAIVKSRPSASLNRDNVLTVRKSPQQKRHQSGTQHIARTMTRKKSVNHSGNATSRRPSRGKRLETRSQATLYLLHAYYDDRDDAALVRMFTVNTGHRLYSAYCYLWTRQHGVSYVVRAVHENLPLPFQRIAVNATRYVSSQLTCNVTRASREGRRFVAVSIGDGANVTTLENYLSIQYPRKPHTLEHDFGVCVVVSYGYMNRNNMTSLVEWFEFNRLLGVTEFNVYNASLQLDKTMRKVFDFYEAENVLRVFSHSTPPFSSPVTQGDAHRLLFYSSLGDCLYRNMYRYKYLVTIDFDEIIVPTALRSYAQLMASFCGKNQSNPRHHCSLRFLSRAYFKEYGAAMTSHPEALNTNRQAASLVPAMRYRSYSLDPGRPKAIHNPRHCVLMSQHRCRAQGRLRDVHSDDVASVHHYRDSCLMPHTGKSVSSVTRRSCAKQAKNTRVDSDILRFQQDLSDRVKRVYSALQIHINET